MDVDKVVDEVTDMVVAIKVEKVVGMVFPMLSAEGTKDEVKHACRTCSGVRMGGIENF